MPDQNGRPLITESRLEEIEQRVRDASERGGRNWYKTDVPELLRAVRVERERAERLEQALRRIEALRTNEHASGFDEAREIAAASTQKGTDETT